MTRLRWSVLAATMMAFGVAALETSPSQLVNLNWDNGGYVADLATTRDYLVRPWSAHFAIAPLYAAGAAIVRLFHGTIFDGLRLATIFAFTLSGFLIADLVAAITTSALATFGLTALFATFWVNQFLLLTVEDNLLYVPLLVLLFRVSLLREAGFRRRDALLAGAIAGLAYMLSLQALLYIFPALWLCLLARPAHDDAISPRLGNVGLCIVGGVLAIGAVLVLMSIGRAELGTLYGTLVTPPNPPLRMRAPSDWLGAFDALGWAAGLSIQHSAYSPPPTYGIGRTNLGLVFLLIVIAYTAWLARRAWRDRSITLGLVALTLVFFTIATPLRIDDGYAYLKRFDFFPACLALSLAFVGKRHARALGGVALFVAAVQLGLGLRWAARHRAEYASLPCPPPQVHPSSTNYGRDGKSWVKYFRDLREAHPQACAFVFDVDEISEGAWWQEIPGALWSELPDHVVLGLKSQVQLWRHPPRMADPRREDRRQWTRPCAVVSCAARARLAIP